MSDKEVRSYCSQNRDEIAPVIAYNPIASRSGRRVLKRMLAEAVLGRELATRSEMRAIYERALRTLAQQDDEEDEGEETDDELADASGTALPEDELFDASETAVRPCGEQSCSD